MLKQNRVLPSSVVGMVSDESNFEIRERLERFGDWRQNTGSDSALRDITVAVARARTQNNLSPW